MENIFELMETMSKATMACSVALADINDPMAVMSIIGTVLDEWASNRGMTSEETLEMFTTLAEVAPMVHAELGAFGEEVAHES